MGPALPTGGLAAAALSILEGAGRQILFSTLVCAALLAASPWLRRRSPWLRHALWSLVLVRLVLPPGLASPLSLRSLWDRGQALVAALLAAPASSAAGFGGALSTAGLDPGASPASPPTPAWAPWLLALWLAAAAVVWLMGRRRLAAYRRHVTAAGPVADPRLLGLVERWREELGVRRPVRLAVGSAPVSPFTLGLLAPVIFLPRAVLDRLGAAAAEVVIAHEMAHIRRWDHLWLRLEAVVANLYFFHPATWVAAARLHREREGICDRMVLARGLIPPRDYARTLLGVLRLNLAGAEPLPAFGNAKRRYEMRLRDIVEQGPRRRPRPALALAAAVAAGAVLLPLASPPGRAAEAAVGGQEAETSTAAASFANPLPAGRVTSPYGPTRDPWSGEVVHHRGIDVAAPAGEGVGAAAAGVVEVATTRYSGGASHGTVVVLDHGGGVKTFYSHLETLDVEAGQKVGRGQQLGLVGATGRVTGRHLHFEVWQDGEPVDPARYVAGWPRGPRSTGP